MQIFNGKQKNNKLPVKWISYIYDSSGYADEARNMVTNLDQEKFHIRILPVDQKEKQGVIDVETETKINKMINNEVAQNAISIQWLPAYFISPDLGAQANIGRTMFETDTIPTGWVLTCNSMDEIWVPTQFNIETFSRAGVSLEKLFKIPEGIDSGQYCPTAKAVTWPGKKSFNFFSVFVWDYRKGWDILLKAYLSEFKKHEDVALVLKVSEFSNTFSEIQQEMFQYVRSLGFNPGSVPDVLLINHFYNSNQMASLYASCDAFVLPSRGEGWGRPYMEAMSTGLPTIGTRWSGNLEFMNDKNSYLIDIEGLRDVTPTDVFKGHQWAQPSLEHTMALMREVYENREQAREKGRIARQDILDNWTWAKAAEKIEHRLEKYR